MIIQFSHHAVNRVHQRFEYEMIDLFHQLERVLVDETVLEKDGCRSATGRLRGKCFKVIFRETSPMQFLVITLMWSERGFGY